MRDGSALAIQWLLAQEHQHFRLLQQNEASDWADIMPRSGFVLYTNALWYHVKRLYGLEHARETRANFNGLFHPFSAGLAEYRRARLLNDYALRRARNRDLYLSFVNFSFFGEEGDVFGNVLALLLGVAPASGLSQDAAAHCSARSARALPGARRRAPDPHRAAPCGASTWAGTGRTSNGSTTMAASGRWWADSGSRRSRAAGASARRAPSS